MALVVLVIVLTAVASTLVLTSQVQRETISQNRARSLAEQALADTDAISFIQLGHYKDDPIADTVTLPNWACAATTDGVCAKEYVVRRDLTRPTSGLVPMPLPVRTVTVDGSAADVAKGLAKRVFTIKTYVTGKAKNPNSGQKKVSVEVTWRDGTKNRVFGATRYREQGRSCVELIKVGGFGPGNCLSIVSLPTAASTFGAGTFSMKPLATNSKPQVLAKVVSGVVYTDAPVKVSWQLDAYTENTDGSGTVFDGVASVELTLFNGTKVPLVQDLATGVWNYTIPTGTSMGTFVAATGDSTGVTLSVWATLTSGVAAAGTSSAVTPKIVTSAVPSLRANGTTGNVFPDSTGSPVGALRIAPNDAGTGIFTNISRLCTKPDGTLWRDQMVFFDAVNFDPQDFLPSVFASTSVADPRWGSGMFNIFYNAYKLSATGPAAGRAQTYLNSGNSTDSLRYVGLVSGSVSTVGALSITRWTWTFATQANAPANGQAAKFFQPSVTLNITATRHLDKIPVTESITIPVYQSTTGTVADCTSGTAAQPTYAY